MTLCAGALGWNGGGHHELIRSRLGGGVAENCSGELVRVNRPVPSVLFDRTKWLKKHLARVGRVPHLQPGSLMDHVGLTGYLIVRHTQDCMRAAVGQASCETGPEAWLARQLRASVSSLGVWRLRPALQWFEEGRGTRLLMCVRTTAKARWRVRAALGRQRSRSMGLLPLAQGAGRG